MFRGLATTELYEDCIKLGLCQEHLKELQVQDESQRRELQRKTMLYIRLQILRPILFDKPFTSEKIKTLLDEAGYFNVNGRNLVPHDDFIEQVLTLDSVVVFTLVKLSNICCTGALFRTNHRTCTDNPFLKLLTQKTIEVKDIAYFGPNLNANFSDYDEGLIKISYVAVLLYVRNVAMHANLRNILDQQDLTFQSLSKEGAQWNDIGSDAYKRHSWEEAVDAFTKAVEYNPYLVSLLINRAQSYMKLDKFKDAALDCYSALMIKPTYLDAYCKWATSLYIQSQFSECLKVAEYGLNICKDFKTEDTIKYRALEKIKTEANTALERKKAASEKQEASASPKKDLPELIEASDSETECQDVPELMDASNSDESDSEPYSTNTETKCQLSAASVDYLTKSSKDKAEGSISKTSRVRSSSASEASHQKVDLKVNYEKNKAGESASKTSRIRNSSVSDVCDQKDNSEERIKMLQMSLKDASNTLIDGCELMAMRRFRDVLDEIKAAPEIHKYEECDIICIKYAYAFACYQSGGFDDLQKAISVLQEVTEEHKNIAFPTAYYTMGLAYHKLNRFKQALQYLKMVEDILQKGVHSKVYVWPGTTVIINETKLDFLKKSLPPLIKECENPPLPDAVCRYEVCTLQPSIYYSDPDFKGFFTINCSEQCNLQYHPQCWKCIKMAKNCTDKLFLEQQCFTPDCEGIVIKIQNISKEGNVAKEFVHADGKKVAKPKKSKLEKKLEIKEEKRRKRKDSTRTDSTSEVPEEIANEKLNEPEAVSSPNEPEIQAKSENKDNANGHNIPQLPVDAEPLIVLKKEKFIQEPSNKIPMKVKEHKKFKNNTYSIDEFLQHSDAPLYSNDYQLRLNTLRQNNQSLTDGIWSKSSVNSAALTSFTTDDIHPHLSSTPPLADCFEEPKMESAGLDDFPDLEFPKPLIDISECLKKNIYNYFREILGKSGPMHVDDPTLLKKISSFPDEARIIADCGGIGKFLQQNFEFAFVKDTYICLVEQLPVAYRKINEASLPIHDSDLKISDNYENFDDNDNNSSELFRFSSGLNPDAREYKPGASPNEPSSHNSEDNVSDKKAKKDKLVCNSPELTSAATKLKQPLKVNLENSLKNDELTADVESLPQQTKTEGVNHQSRRSSISSTNSCSHNLVDIEYHSGNKVTELVNTFKELIRMYYSDEMIEHRPYIDAFLKPYTIGSVPKKYTRSVQTEEKEKVSRGTMKTDDEIQELKDLISHLNQDRQILEQEYSAALEYASKFQNKSSAEMINMRKELEDKTILLENVEKEFKNKEEKLEKDLRIFSEVYKKIKAEMAEQKKEIEKLLTAKDSLLLDRVHLEEKVFSLQQEEQKLREDISEDGKLKNSIKKLETEKTEAERRAKSAELLLLQLKKSEFLKRIDIKQEEATKKMKEVQDGIAMLNGNLSPLYIKSVEELLTQIRNYIALLEDIKRKFMANIDEQINEVNNDVPLSKLKPLEVEELPDIPTWNMKMPSMFTSQPTWGTPQMGNSAYNTGTFHPFSFASVNPLNLSSNLTSSVSSTQPTNQDQKQQPPLQNGRRSSFSDSLNQRSNVSIPPVTKAPPGMKNTTTSIHAPATSMLNLNSSLKQSAMNGETKQKGASNSNIAAAAATCASPSDKNIQFAYATATPAASLTINDVKKITTETKIATSSLELDYKGKKPKSVENPIPLSNNFPPKTISTEPKKTTDNAKKSYDKLLNKLQEKFPKYSQAELIDCVKEFRTKRKAGLSGLSLDSIINSVSEIIEAKMRSASSQVKMPDSAPKAKMMPNAVLVNKKLVAETKAKEPLPTNESSAAKKSAWGVSDSEGSKQWTGSEIDEGCIICYEDMTYRTAYRVDCGHHFHFKCIKEWLNKKSDCPICRVHLLLPEDYPALS